MAHRHALALLVALLLPALARAEPAVVAVFEAVARAEPSPTAEALQTLVEGTAITVSEEARDGWRRVRLTGGGTGWIEERALAFPAKTGAAALAVAPAVPVPPPGTPAQAAPPPAPDLRPRIYVKDLDHLAELVKEDPSVAPKAAALARKRRTAMTVFAVGAGAGAVLILVGASQMGEHRDPSDPNFGKSSGTGTMTAGLITTVGALLVGLAVSPSQGDLLDVINAWNTSHPDQPFTLDRHAVGR